MKVNSCCPAWYMGTNMRNIITSIKFSRFWCDKKVHIVCFCCGDIILSLHFILYASGFDKARILLSERICSVQCQTKGVESEQHDIVASKIVHQSDICFIAFAIRLHMHSMPLIVLETQTTRTWQILDGGSNMFMFTPKIGEMIQFN